MNNAMNSVKVDFKSVTADNRVREAKRRECVKAEFFLINESCSLEAVKEKYFNSNEFAIMLKMKNYDIALIELSEGC